MDDTHQPPSIDRHQRNNAHHNIFYKSLRKSILFCVLYNMLRFYVFVHERGREKNHPQPPTHVDCFIKKLLCDLSPTLWILYILWLCIIEKKGMNTHPPSLLLSAEQSKEDLSDTGANWSNGSSGKSTNGKCSDGTAQNGESHLSSWVQCSRFECGSHFSVFTNKSFSCVCC